MRTPAIILALLQLVCFHDNIMACSSFSASPSTSSKTRATIADYDCVAAGYDQGNQDHDVAQNIEALLGPLEKEFGPPLQLLDLGCAGGRDLITFQKRGHQAQGMDGSPALVALAQQRGCQARVQDLFGAAPPLQLPTDAYHGVYSNAVLMHCPSESLEGVLHQIFQSLKPGGIFFASIAHGFGEDREQWSGGRTPQSKSWCCFWSEATWKRKCTKAGFELVDSFYRGRTQAFLATVWRKPLS